MKKLILAIICLASITVHAATPPTTETPNFGTDKFYFWSELHQDVRTEPLSSRDHRYILRTEIGIEAGDIVQIGSDGKLPALDGSNLIGVPSVDDVLPAQAGYAGYFLTTDGATPYWVSSAGAGDMLKGIYDTNNNLIVDSSEQLSGASGVNASTAAEVRTHLDDSSQHRLINDSGLTATDLYSASKINTIVGERLAAASNLSDLTSAATARTNLGLGNASTRNVGTSPTTVAQGDAPINAISAHELSYDHTDLHDHVNKATLDKIPDDTAAASGQVITKQGDGSLAWADQSGTGTATFGSLSDTPSDFIGQAGKFVYVNPGETALEYVDPPTGGSQSFSGLTDTPGDYTSFSGLVPAVKATTDGLEYIQVLKPTNNLSDIGSASVARTNLGLGASATLGVGATAGTVAAGNHVQTVATGGTGATDATTARTNLGLGSAAVTASTAYATALQGISADTAHGWGDHSAGGYLTAETQTGATVNMGVTDTADIDEDAVTAETLTSDQADTALDNRLDVVEGWGDHSGAGYLAVELDPAVTTHAAAADPHTGYLLESAAGTAALLDSGTTIGSVPIYQDDGSGNPVLPVGPVIDASGFNGNLAITDDTIQEVAQKLDDLTVGGASALNDLSDVNTTGVVNGSIIKHNGTSWVVGTDNTAAGSGYAATVPTYSDEACTAGQYAFSTTTGFVCVASGDWNTFSLTDWSNPSPASYTLSLTLAGLDGDSVNGVSVAGPTDITGLSSATYALTETFGGTNDTVVCTGAAVTGSANDYTVDMSNSHESATCTFSASGGASYPAEDFGWGFNNTLVATTGGNDLSGAVGAFSATTPPEGTHYRTAPDTSILTVATPSSLPFGPADYSVSFWVLPNSSNIFTLFYAERGGWENAVKISLNALKVEVEHATAGVFDTDATTGTLTVDVWNLITVSYDDSAGTATVWASVAAFGDRINAQVLTKSESPGNTNATTVVKILDVENTYVTNGIDDFKVWTGTALTAADAEALYGSY